MDSESGNKTPAKQQPAANARCAPQLGTQPRRMVSAADVATQMEALKQQFDRYNKLSTV